MITSYIHSESRPQLLEYLAGGFQTVGYKFSDIPCPNSGNYVNFWIKLSTEGIENKFRNQFGKFYYFQFSGGLQISPR